MEKLFTHLISFETKASNKFLCKYIVWNSGHLIEVMNFIGNIYVLEGKILGKISETFFPILWSALIRGLLLGKIHLLSN